MSSKAQNVFNASQKNFNIKKHNLLKPSGVRWNAIYLSLARNLEQKKPICDVLSTCALEGVSSINENNWIITQELVNLLAPFYSLTQLFQSQKQVTISMAFYGILTVKKKLGIK